MIIGISIAILITTCLTLWMSSALNTGERAADVERDNDATTRSATLVSDLELDFAMGKLSPQDYERLRTELQG